MIDANIVCKTIASVAMCAAIAVIGYETDNSNCLWALWFVVLLW